MGGGTWEVVGTWWVSGQVGERMRGWMDQGGYQRWYMHARTHACTYACRTHLLLGAEEKVVGGAKLNGMLVRHSSQQHRDLGPRRHVLVGIAPHVHPLHRAPQYTEGLDRLLTVRQSRQARDEPAATVVVVGC